ncbi:coadhesin-like isoform X2 [Tigriopus californicus]|uniref:coadhesin-like isoform X2 n=1 Tax=Tigriopus californicus TaxID=6832 RepID=UPI0027DA2F15|nr:coadhesin-like isoform X2 [Tigriopus californicus]
MRVLLAFFVLLSFLSLGNARMIEYFELGEGCGVTSEIKLHSKPLEISNQKGCVLVQFPATAEFELENEKKNYRIADQIKNRFGGWAEWSEWSICSKTCGSGQKTRSRTCDSDQPDLYCKGGTTSVRYCLVVSCPVNGHWSEWSFWDACSTDCDMTVETRSRSCTNPAPKHGGDSCFGSEQEVRNCTSEAICPGSWSAWVPWSACNPSIGDCGDGAKSRTRTCDNPAPRNGGDSCNGQDRDSLNCRVPCGPPGEWNTWGPWGNCDNTVCGKGLESRSRDCGASSNEEPCPLEDAIVDTQECEKDCKASGM